MLINAGCWQSRISPFSQFSTAVSQMRRGQEAAVSRARGCRPHLVILELHWPHGVSPLYLGTWPKSDCPPGSSETPAIMDLPGRSLGPRFSANLLQGEPDTFGTEVLSISPRLRVTAGAVLRAILALVIRTRQVKEVQVSTNWTVSPIHDCLGCLENSHWSRENQSVEEHASFRCLSVWRNDEAS